MYVAIWKYGRLIWQLKCCIMRIMKISCSPWSLPKMQVMIMAPPMKAFTHNFFLLQMNVYKGVKIYVITETTWLPSEIELCSWQWDILTYLVHWLPFCTVLCSNCRNVLYLRLLKISLAIFEVLEGTRRHILGSWHQSILCFYRKVPFAPIL